MFELQIRTDCKWRRVAVFCDEKIARSALMRLTDLASDCEPMRIVDENNCILVKHEGGCLVDNIVRK